MSTQGIRDFRPKIHFTTQKGWINDPNGLVYYGGKYHLFYQFHPHDTCWGPMHWGHAVSDDLINWEHLPIALYPDENGTIFSGSALADTNNISGFGKDGKIPLVAFYTCHGDQQVQSIAYSLDGINFTKYENNPVIPNPGIRDFRDPKMFWNPVRNCWSMTLAAADRAFFYKTDDLKTWVKTGEFGPEGNHVRGVWECTDMVPFEHNGRTIWMLIASMGQPSEDPFIGTQYFLGEFDGDTFTCTMPLDHAERLDSGYDSYAGVTYNNVDRSIFFGWCTCPKYADKTPTGEYCGTMTLPRQLSLVDTPTGPKVASFPTNIDGIFSEGRAVESGTPITNETFKLMIKGSGAAKISLKNEKGQILSFGMDAENYLFFDRSQAGAKDFSELYASPMFNASKAKRFFDESYTMDFIFDVSVAELFVDQGTRNMTMVCYPDTPYNILCIEGDVEVQVFGLAI